MAARSQEYPYATFCLNEAVELKQIRSPSFRQFFCCRRRLKGETTNDLAVIRGGLTFSRLAGIMLQTLYSCEVNYER
jgi:hypothetical protein